MGYGLTFLAVAVNVWLAVNAGQVAGDFADLQGRLLPARVNQERLAVHVGQRADLLSGFPDVVAGGARQDVAAARPASVPKSERTEQPVLRAAAGLLADQNWRA
jgi:hypothetical protein